ncbi:hypothetical protein GS449_14895 [Rhodococcus hoagii]|nr:hypothetical protein [Prescottella equi]
MALPTFYDINTGAPIGPDVQHTFNNAAGTPTAGVQVDVFGALHDPYNVKTRVTG